MVAMLKMPARVSEDSWADRRIFPRKEIRTTVEGRRIDHTVDARQNPRLRLTLRDVSFGGMSAVVDSPLGKGERLSVIFPPQGNAHGWDAFGRVLRCDPVGAGYRLAVEFDPLPAA